MAMMMYPWERVKFPRTTTDDTTIETVGRFEPSQEGVRVLYVAQYSTTSWMASISPRRAVMTALIPIRIRLEHFQDET